MIPDPVPAPPRSAGDLLLEKVDLWVRHSEECGVEDCDRCVALFNQIRLGHKVWTNSTHKAAVGGAAVPPPLASECVKCVVCALEKPWGIWTPKGEAVCVDCRNAARSHQAAMQAIERRPRYFWSVNGMEEERHAIHLPMFVRWDDVRAFILLNDAEVVRARPGRLEEEHDRESSVRASVDRSEGAADAAGDVRAGDRPEAPRNEDRADVRVSQLQGADPRESEQQGERGAFQLQVARAGPIPARPEDRASCHCPAPVGEDCPLTSEQCENRTKPEYGFKRELFTLLRAANYHEAISAAHLLQEKLEVTEAARVALQQQVEDLKAELHTLNARAESAEADVARLEDWVRTYQSFEQDAKQAETEVAALRARVQALVEKWPADASAVEEGRVGLSWAHGVRLTLRACADQLAAALARAPEDQ